jgi:hypothetical protein
VPFTCNVHRSPPAEVEAGHGQMLERAKANTAALDTSSTRTSSTHTRSHEFHVMKTPTHDHTLQEDAKASRLLGRLTKMAKSHTTHGGALVQGALDLTRSLKAPAVVYFNPCIYEVR